MTTFLAFSETEGLEGVLSGVTNITTGNAVQAGVNRAAIQLVTQAIATARLSTPINEGWVHGRIVPRNSTAISGSLADYMLGIVDENGNIIAGFYQNNTTNGATIGWRAVYFGDPLIGTGANEPTTGVLIGTPDGSAYIVDINFKISDTDGFIRWYVNGSLVREVTGDTQNGASSLISRLRFRALGINSGTDNRHWFQFSQIIVSDESTLGARLHTLPVAAGSVNQWSGSVADVNAADHTPDTYIQDITPGDEILFTVGDISSINTGNEIKALVLSQAALAFAAAPVQRLRGRARLAGTTYNGELKSLAGGYSGVQHFFNTNPATGQKWTLAEANAAELGMQAQA